MSVAAYMKISATLLDEQLKPQQRHDRCFVAECINVYTHALLSQERIADTSKDARYLATTCLSFICWSWLSEEHLCLNVIPLNLTVSQHISVAVVLQTYRPAATTGHNLTQALTTRWNRSRESHPVDVSLTGHSCFLVKTF